MSNSKFKTILDAAKERETSPEAEISIVEEKPKGSKRATGKSSNPDYQPLTVYIRKSTHRKIKKALIDKEQDFSELIEGLLTNWFDSNS